LKLLEKREDANDTGLVKTFQEDKKFKPIGKRKAQTRPYS
jgi:hypothetical protein